MTITTSQRLLHRLERSFLTVGFSALGLCLAAILAGKAYQAYAGWRLEVALQRASTSLPPAVSAGSSKSSAPSLVENGSLIGKIEIPRIGISAIVREGSDAKSLLIAVGHVPGTALPGETGNAVLSGHRDSFFRRLRDIQVNDNVRIVTPTGVLQYRVDSTEVVDATKTSVLAPTSLPTLTLITCYPFGFVGRAPDRFIVHARPSTGPVRD